MRLQNSQYVAKIRLSNSAIKVLEVLIFEGNKSKRELYNKIKEFDKSTIRRSLNILVENKSVEFIKEGEHRNEKIYGVTSLGCAKLYLVKSKYNDALDFHNSPTAEQIRKKWFETFPPAIKNTQENAFLTAFKFSPSFTQFLINYNEMLIPKLIRLEKIDMPKINSIIVSDPTTLHNNFIMKIIPSIFLIQDYEKYPGYPPLKKVLSKALMDIMLDERKIPKRREECFDHWYVYIPIIGKPVIACDGYCTKQCED